jgi:hypothetical protein
MRVSSFAMTPLRALVFGLLMGPVHAAGRVATILAGPFRGTSLTASEYQRSLVDPLVRGQFTVDTYAAGPSDESAQWQTWLSSLTHTTTKFVAYPPDADELARHPERVSYFGRCTQVPYNVRMMHHEDAWRAVQASGVSYDYVVRTRVDLVYGPGQIVKPCWLRSLPESVILNNDKEIHEMDRWNERGISGGLTHQSQMVNEHNISTPPEEPWLAHATFPIWMSDQFMVGKTRTMQQVLTMVSQPESQGGTCRQGNSFWEYWQRDYPNFIESVHADFLFRRKIAVYPVSLQLARAPSTAFLSTPCRLCYDCVGADPYGGA